MLNVILCSMLSCIICVICHFKLSVILCYMLTIILYYLLYVNSKEVGITFPPYHKKGLTCTLTHQRSQTGMD